MRKPTTIERLFLDFDGFFAGVEEQARPRLRGKPIGVTPFEANTGTCIIAANHNAKIKGVKTGMSVNEARHICPSIELVSQSPDLYERAHRKLCLMIEQEIPIDVVCSIDEMSCRLEPKDIANPRALSDRIKARIKANIGDYITCSIGMGPNLQLAKIASDMDKPNGFTVLRPEDLPGRLLDLQLHDIPGIGSRMKTRLINAGISSVEALWNTQPKHLRALWGNVNGERFWYALRGYEIQAEHTQRAMFGHGRVLPPDWRDFDNAFNAARLLTIKAARRLRRESFLANTFGLWLRLKDDRWSGDMHIGAANDDHAAIHALTTLWQKAQTELPRSVKIKRFYVALYHLQPAGAEQFDMFTKNDALRKKWSSVSIAIDEVNQRNSKTLISMGPWTPPPGGYAGGKIAFGRVPDMEDFW